ncbi:MAG: DUF4112 domain-containing protein [Vicinamibacterales bacterium]
MPPPSRPPLPSLRWWAELLDSRFRIPGTSVRFGLDPLLSLIPGIGDLASPVFALVLLVQGLQQRVPRIVLVRMIGNALFDAALGIIPLAGNISDIFWRANSRNLALLERHAHGGGRPARSDYVFVFVMAGVFGALVLIPVVLALWVAVWLLQHGADRPGLF